MGFGGAMAQELAGLTDQDLIDLAHICLTSAEKRTKAFQGEVSTRQIVPTRSSAIHVCSDISDTSGTGTRYAPPILNWPRLVLLSPLPAGPPMKIGVLLSVGLVVGLLPITGTAAAPSAATAP